MKGYERRKRSPLWLIILPLSIMAIIVIIRGNSYARRVNSDHSVYNPPTKTCMSFYCHSNGKGEYRPIKWEDRSSHLGCEACHDFPPKDNTHRNARRNNCGQRCHTQTINNGYTTDYHINGRIEGTYEPSEDGQCLSCHLNQQGMNADAPPAIGFDSQMVINHIGGPPTDHDCIVCHMEETPEYHRNKQVELKNHQGGSFYSVEQYNQFCLSCHDPGNSLFGTAPFSTERPIPSIHYELILKRTQTPGSVRFWYPHNHMADKGYDAAQMKNQSGPNSMFYVDSSNQNHMLMRDLGDSQSSKARYKSDVSGGIMGGGGGMPGGILTVAPMTIGAGPLMGGSPVIAGPAAPILGASPIPGLAAPLMGGASPIASLAPVMGGGTAMMPAVAPAALAPSPVMGGGGIMAPGVTPLVASPSPIMGGGGGMGPGVGATIVVMPGGGNDVMSAVRAGPGNMVMGPGLSPLTGPELMLGLQGPMMGMPGPMVLMPGPMLAMPGPMMPMTSPMMGMPGPMIGMLSPMMGIGGPMMGIGGPMMGIGGPGMGIGGPGMGGIYGPGMGNMPGMPGMGNMPGGPGMGNMPGMPGMGNMPGGPGMGNMPGMPGMGNMPGGPGMGNMPGMPGMGNMPGGPGMGNMPGGPGMNNMPGGPGMGNMPPGMNNMPGMNDQKPTNNNGNNPQDQNQQNNEPNETATCLACHTYENPDYLSLSVIANNFHGHFSHQNCYICHTSHGSRFPGLLKEGINWNKNNGSCSTQLCHPTHMHKPPLADTGISYQLRPESTCNTSSCHNGSGQMGMSRLRAIIYQDPSMEINSKDCKDN